MSLRAIRRKGDQYFRPHQICVYKLRRIKSGRYSWVKDYPVGEPEFLSYSGSRLIELRDMAKNIAREQGMEYIDIIWHGMRKELNPVEEFAFSEQY